MKGVGGRALARVGDLGVDCRDTARLVRALGNGRLTVLNLSIVAATAMSGSRPMLLIHLPTSSGRG